MTKPNLPTQQEMRDHCRAAYGHYSNMSREWLKTKLSGAQRIILYGYSKIDRDMAELWEADFLAASIAEQDVFIDWYIDHYRGAMYDSHGDSPERRTDPNREDPMYGLAGISTGWWTPDTCEDRGCKIKVTGGAWHHTIRTCPAHSAVGQDLLDTVRGENIRKNTALVIVESVMGLDTKENFTTWSFDSSQRIADTDERVLSVEILTNMSNPQRTNIQGAADVQFGIGAILVV